MADEEPDLAEELEELAAIVVKYRDQLTHYPFNFFSSIPSQEIEAARAAYANFGETEEPLVLIDTSSMCNQTAGALLTDAALYVKNEEGGPWRIDLTNIRSVILRSPRHWWINWATLDINGRKLLLDHCVQPASRPLFANMVHDIMGHFHPDLVPEKDSEAPTAELDLTLQDHVRGLTSEGLVALPILGVLVFIVFIMARMMGLGEMLGDGLQPVDVGYILVAIFGGVVGTLMVLRVFFWGF